MHCAQAAGRRLGEWMTTTFWRNLSSRLMLRCELKDVRCAVGAVRPIALKSIAHNASV